MDERFPPAALAQLSFAVAAREVADSCYALVAHLDQGATLGERLRQVREMRAHSALAWQRAVLAELLAGADWAEVAAAVGWSEGSLRAQFEPVIDVWRSDPSSIDLGDVSPEVTVGNVTDRDPRTTAASLDAWILRHREPWDDPPERPVTHALTG